MTSLKIIGLIFLTVWGAAEVSQAAATNRYVATNSPAPAWPYDSWANAATNIKPAVDAANANNAGDLVIISNGTYYLTGQILVSNTVVTSASGDRALVIVNGNYPDYTNRCFYLNDPAARLVALTIVNGAVWTNNLNGSGGGVYLNNGCVSNCAIVGNRSWVREVDRTGGGGIFIVNGEVSDCLIASNTVYMPGALWGYSGGGGAFVRYGTLKRSRLLFNAVTNNTGSGGGVYIGATATTTGIVYQCEIISNVVYNDGTGGGVGMSEYGFMSNSVIMHNLQANPTGIEGGGGGVNMHWAKGDLIVRNCLIANNKSQKYGGGIKAGRMYGSLGRIENCTIVSNYGLYGGGIVLIDTGGAASVSNVVNCIVYSNKNSLGAANDDMNDYNGLANHTALVYCCVSPSCTWPNPGGFTNNPLVVAWPTDTDAGNWRLTKQSPCINTGTNRDWMATSVDLDGHNRQDKFSGLVDMGCYEYLSSGVMLRLK